jgi:hypothetical protein
MKMGWLWEWDDYENGTIMKLGLLVLWKWNNYENGTIMKMGRLWKWDDYENGPKWDDLETSSMYINSLMFFSLILPGNFGFFSWEEIKKI